MVDPEGRAYLGNFGFDLYKGEPLRPTTLHRVDPDGRITKVADDLWFPNGCAITPERVLLVNETFGNRVTAFDLTQDGELTNRRTWAEFGPLPTAVDTDAAFNEVEVAPDGSCLDSAGALWIADIKGNRLLRLVDGEIVEQIARGTCVFAVRFGRTHRAHTLHVRDTRLRRRGEEGQSRFQHRRHHRGGPCLSASFRDSATGGLSP